MQRRSLGIATLMLLCLSAATLAADTAYHQTVDGVAIYFGIVPAEVVRGHPPAHPEGQMHGGVQFNESHLTVALFNAKSGQRIRKAEVHVSVKDTQGIGVRRKLEPMLFDSNPTFGNYIPMPGAGPYRIELEIKIPGRKRPIVASFTWARS